MTKPGKGHSFEELVSSPTSVLQHLRRESLDSEGGGVSTACGDPESFPCSSRSFHATPERGHFGRGDKGKRKYASVLENLCELFPGRESEITSFLRLLGEPCDYLLPLLVYGAPATGKTRIVKKTFCLLERPYAYVSIRSCHNARLLFESVIGQLEGHVRSASSGYSSAKRCDKIMDFFDCLPGACDKAISLGRKKRGKRSVAAQDQQVSRVDKGAEVVYVVIDNLELIREWTGGSSLLAALLRVPEHCRLPNLALIFISNLGPDSFQSDTGFRDLSPLYFREYNDEELRRILLKEIPHAAVADLFSTFLSAVLKSFSRSTRRVTELSQSLEPLFGEFCKPICSARIDPSSEAGKNELCRLVWKHIRPALAQTFPAEYNTAPSSAKVCASGSDTSVASKKTTKLPYFQLSKCSKFLLLAAYIASRTPATLDGPLFDSTDSIKRSKPRCSVLSLEKKVLKIREKQLKGPGSFPLERLLGIFRSIVVHNSTDLEEVSCTDEEPVGVTADVLMQISTLSSVNLLVKGCSNPLDSIPRYSCNADEDFIQEVAMSLKFSLSKYIQQG